MATPLTFGNHLKFGPDSYHKTKGRPTFLHREREREHPKLCTNHTHSHWEGPSTGRTCMWAVATKGGRTNAHDSGGFLSATKNRGWASTPCDDLKPPKEASPSAIREGPICYPCRWSEATQRGSTISHERKRVESMTKRDEGKKKRKRRERSEFEVRGRDRRD